jgi:hypothetical protein
MTPPARIEAAVRPAGGILGDRKEPPPGSALKGRHQSPRCISLQDEEAWDFRTTTATHERVRRQIGIDDLRPRWAVSTLLNRYGRTGPRPLDQEASSYTY